MENSPPLPLGGNTILTQANDERYKAKRLLVQNGFLDDCALRDFLFRIPTFCSEYRLLIQERLLLQGRVLVAFLAWRWW